MANIISGKSYGPISATQSQFTLPYGGRYAAVVMATWNAVGTVTLSRLAGDGTTLIPVTPAWTANTYAVLELPSGVYQVSIATATNAYIDIMSVSNFI